MLVATAGLNCRMSVIEWITSCARTADFKVLPLRCVNMVCENSPTLEVDDKTARDPFTISSQTFVPWHVRAFAKTEKDAQTAIL